MEEYRTMKDIIKDIEKSYTELGKYFDELNVMITQHTNG